MCTHQANQIGASKLTTPFYQTTQSQVNIRTPERVLDFAFDKVFHGGAAQADVYESVRHVVLGVMDGFNGTLLAYGQVRLSGWW